MMRLQETGSWGFLPLGRISCGPLATRRIPSLPSVRLVLRLCTGPLFLKPVKCVTRGSHPVRESKSRSPDPSLYPVS